MAKASKRKQVQQAKREKHQKNCETLCRQKRRAEAAAKKQSQPINTQ